MSLKQENFPDLVGVIELAGRLWTYVLVGDYEYDTVEVKVTLLAGRTKHGPFPFYAGEFEEPDDIPFSQDCVQRLGEAVLQTMAKYWPLDF